MSKTYHYKKGAMQKGPYNLDFMRALARQGEIGRSQQISRDDGSSWDSGIAYPEIFAAGDENVVDPGRGPEVNPQPTVPTEATWHFSTASGGQQGPTPESQLRQLIEVGGVGPSDMVWTESLGDQWVIASAVPRFSGLFPKLKSVNINLDEPDQSRARKRRDRSKTSRRDTDESEGKQRGFSGAGLSGFICSMVAIILLAIPCLVWVVVAESFFWIFNIVIPFTILAIVGLVLSVIGLSKVPRGMATTGTVLGVIALMLGVMAIFGWFMLPYRMAMQNRTAIDSFATDIKLEQKNLADELAKYRKIIREEAESDEQWESRASSGRRRVGEQLDTLVKAYDGHVTSTAKTSDFQEAFMELASLRKLIDDVKQAAQAVEGVELIDVLQVSNADVRAVKVLMDTLHLYERGEITIKQAEAKMTGR